MLKPQTSPLEDEELPHDAVYRDAATRVWANDDLQIDADAKVSASDDGAWVSAWVWVSNEEAIEDDGDEKDAAT
jgi:hypothetical protein